MKDLESSRMMWLKGVLFALIGIVATVLLVAEMPTLKVTILIAVAIWAFCRAYYFAFYVIEHYVDGSYHFSGLWSFVVYCWRRKSNPTNVPR